MIDKHSEGEQRPLQQAFTRLTDIYYDFAGIVPPARRKTYVERLIKQFNRGPRGKIMEAQTAFRKDSKIANDPYIQASQMMENVLQQLYYYLQYLLSGPISTKLPPHEIQLYSRDQSSHNPNHAITTLALQPRPPIDKYVNIPLYAIETLIDISNTSDPRVQAIQKILEAFNITTPIQARRQDILDKGIAQEDSSVVIASRFPNMSVKYGFKNGNELSQSLALVGSFAIPKK